MQAQCFVQQHISQILPALCKAYPTDPQADASQASTQAKFMFKLAGQQALSSSVAAVLSIPSIPVQLKQLLLQAGLQPTTVELVAASRARVQGLEGWLVQADDAQAAFKGVVVSSACLQCGVTSVWPLASRVDKDGHSMLGS
jgi:hypothetical protein